MAKIKRYDSYKNSGVEWLGQIPSHWEIVRLGVLGFFSSSGIDKNIRKREPFVKIINFTDIYSNSKHILDNSIPYMQVTTPENIRIKNLVQKGDLIFLPSSETYKDLGLSALVDEKLENTSFSYHVIRLHFNKEYIEHRFKKYLTNNNFVLNQFSSWGKGTTRKIIGRNVFKNVQVVIPPKDEQEKIASYLDEKIAKIDASISGKEKFIELLKEQKQIIINGAVTKGLNKNAKFKNSGVEWLGEIPSHWEILANKYIFKLKRNLVGKRSNKYVLLSLTLDGIVERDLDKGGKFPAEFDTYQEVKNGDFVFCLFDVEETPRTIGLSEYDGIITGAYTVFDVRNVSKKYLYYFYLNLDNNKRLKPLYLGLRNTISKENFFSFKTFIPPKDEQIQIVEYIENKISKIDKLLNLEQECIKSLKEYKASLIDSVVTGKVKV